MKLVLAAVAAALTLSSVGCQSMNSCRGPMCHVAQSQGAPRPLLRPGGCGPQNCLENSMAGCSEGCGQGNCGCQSCPHCGGQGCNACCHGNTAVNGVVGAVLDCAQSDAAYGFNPGPAVAQTAYPYYTTRGPRDFLMKNPPSIGPGGYATNCPNCY